jgi:hypothetical protein
LVADFLKAKIRDGSRLSVVSAYFTIYAYEALKDHLDRIEHLDFLFGEPRFISSLDPDKTEKKAFILDGQGLHLGGKYKYELKHLELAKWLKDLQRDKEQLSTLHASAKDVTPARDAKLKELKRFIERKVKNPTTNKLGQPNRKALVFTAFADTAAYLFKELTTWAHRELGIHIALVAGSGDNHTTFGRSDFNQMAVEFCLSRIWDQPALTDKITRYLSLWTDRDDVRQMLNKALFGDGELFDTQYLSLLPLLRQSGAIAMDHRTRLLRLTRRELHWAAKAEALLTLMIFPLEEKHFEQLRRAYDREASPYVKKVILALFLKAPFWVKQRAFKETITEPEEETNRLRKFLWSMGNNPEKCKPTLKTVGKVERDPARLLVSLHGALQSPDTNVLRQVKQIADVRAASAASELARLSFAAVAKAAQAKLAGVTKQKPKRPTP